MATYVFRKAMIHAFWQCHRVLYRVSGTNTPGIIPIVPTTVGSLEVSV